MDYIENDINMLWQSTAKESGEALKNLSESLSFAIANENINN